MIDVAVADDQSVECARVDLEHTDIVDDRRGGVTEIEKDGALLLLALRFQKQRQPPFVMEDVARISAAGRSRALMNDAVHSAAAQKLVVLLINQHADRKFIDCRHLDWCRASDADTGKSTGSSNAREHRGIF